jgi:hypothetical protein
VYTVVANLVNWPAGIVTCGKAGKELDEPYLKSDTKYEPACKFYHTVGSGGSVRHVLTERSR